MAKTATGTVTRLIIKQDPLDSAAGVWITDSGGGLNIFILWDDTSDFPTWVSRTLNVSLLRTALENKLTVEIGYDPGTLHVQQVHLLGS